MWKRRISNSCRLPKRWGWGLVGEAIAKGKTSNNFKHSVLLKTRLRIGQEGLERGVDV